MESNEYNNMNEELDLQDQEESQLSACKAQLMRATADLSNYQRRVEKERAEWSVYSQVSVIKSLIQFLPELDRAVEQAESKITGSDAVWLEGFALINKNVKKAFVDLGVTEIDCSGSFDPELHEALMQVEDDQYVPGQIIQVLEKGYQFKNQVIRYAKVSVAK